MQAVNGIKIFELNECDKWAGRDAEECIQAALKIYGMDRDEFLMGYEPREIGDDEFNSLYMLVEPDGDGVPEPESYRSVLDRLIAKGMDTFPCLFCTTEY